MEEVVISVFLDSKYLGDVVVSASADEASTAKEAENLLPLHIELEKTMTSVGKFVRFVSK